MRKIGAGILLMIILLASCAQPNEIGDGQYNETHSVVSEASFDSAWMEAQQNFRNSYEMDILSSYNVESNYDDLSVGISLFLDFSIDFPFVASIKAGTVLNSEDPDYQELVSMYDEMLLDHQKLCQQTNDYFESQGISGVTVTFTLYANEDELFAEIMNGEVKYELVSEIMNSTPEPRENCDFYNAVYQDTMETIMYYNPMALSAADTVALSGLTIAGFNANAVFLIDPDYGFYQGVYDITDEEISTAHYIGNFETLKTALTETYGTPIRDEIVSLDSLSQYANQDTALELGMIQFVATWQTERSDIQLLLTIDNNYDLKTLISYTSREFTPGTNTDGL